MLLIQLDAILLPSLPHKAQRAHSPTLLQLLDCQTNWAGSAAEHCRRAQRLQVGLVVLQQAVLLQVCHVEAFSDLHEDEDDHHHPQRESEP